MSDPTRRAERLVRWYPRAWRLRYGDEFVELLVADIAETPRSWRRGLDVALNGLGARFGEGGLVHGVDSVRRARAGLASLAAASAAFSIMGAAIWSQLAIGWEWSRPSAPETAAAVVLMFCVLLVLAGLASLAALPYFWACARRLWRGEFRGVIVPLALFVASAAVMVLGARHFAAGWPGTGGHPWAHQHLVPGRLAALAWASTLSITSYWAHPAALLGFPPEEVAWMLASPFALGSLVVTGAKLVKRIELSPRALRFELALAKLACVAMIGFVVGPCLWIVGGESGPRNLFHIGAIDVAGVVLMCVTLALAWRSTRRAREAIVDFA